MSHKVVAILNPIAGRRSAAYIARRVGRLVELHGGEFALLETRRAGHATVLAQELRGKVDAVLIVGGDGTVGEVLNGLQDQRVPLVILGTGTENLLAQELGMPTTVSAAAHALLHGRPMAVDLGIVNDRRFIVVVGVGFDAECVVRMNRVRRGHITHLSYFWPIWRTFWEHRFPILRIEADGACAFEGRGLCLIGMISRYSAGLRVLCRAKCDDGLLDLCVFPCASRTKLVGHALSVLRRLHATRRDVIYRQCRRIRVSSPQSVPVEVDGELAGGLPIECAIRPGAVEVLHVDQGGDGAPTKKSLADRLTKWGRV